MSWTISGTPSFGAFSFPLGFRPLVLLLPPPPPLGLAAENDLGAVGGDGRLVGWMMGVIEVLEAWD